MALDLLVVGLGNPGKQYQRTRHNAGFLFCDYAAAFFDKPFHFGPGSTQILEGTLNGFQIVLAKPLTFMNRSGLAVRALVEAFELPLEKILVVCDDFQLPLGTVRIRKAGSSGGHNGLQSIIDELGSSQFPRMRLGIGREGPIENWVEFVLSNFSRKELERLRNVFPYAWEAVRTILRDGWDKAMSLYNRRFLEGETRTEEGG